MVGRGVLASNPTCPLHVDQSCLQEDEEEEAKLREELKSIDAALKKVKKHPAVTKSVVKEPAEAREATTSETTNQGATD